ncbi:MAG: prolipoprotein diacylglyceryl transferase [Myxococcales bacterium]|nr:prolipoprotein diacylglyceryl transferase [Myxococcales bacterium]MCB9566320.1 prolipoprotein diacylglyceryl transferase [Myxococcales bacterium]
MRPILFEIPGLGWPLQSYGVAMGLALLVAWFASLDRARTDGLPTDTLGTLFVVAAFAGIVGGRALWLLQHPGAGGLGDLISLPAGGLTVTGGILAALVVSALGCWRRGIDTFAWLDAVAPGFAIGLVIERIGAFLAGVEFGRYVAPGDLGYALHVTFPAGSPVHAFHQQLLKGLPTLSAEASAPVHPVQLYAALMGLGILAVAIAVRRRRRYPGQVALAVLAAFTIARLVIEDPLRFDASPTLWGPLRVGHVSALGLLAVLAIVARLRRAAALAAEAR